MGTWKNKNKKGKRTKKQGKKGYIPEMLLVMNAWRMEPHQRISWSLGIDDRIE